MTMVCSDIEALIEPFRAQARALLEELHRKRIPVKPFETHRALQRSAFLWTFGREGRRRHLLKRTNAKPGESAHNWGLALDCVLDVKVVPVRLRAWRGRRVPDAWDNETPAAKEVWEAYGGVVQARGLVWGGTFNIGGRPDLPHCEMPNWRKHRPENWRLEVQRVLKAAGAA